MSQGADDLEVRLTALAADFDGPAGIDLAPAVRRRVAGPRRRRRWVLGAIAAAAVPAAGVGAVGAASGWFEIGRTRVDPAPATQPTSDPSGSVPGSAPRSPSTVLAPLPEGLALVRPAALGPPDAVGVEPSSERVVMTWSAPDGATIRFGQRPADETSPLGRKLTDPSAVEQVLVGRRLPGLWLGGEHMLVLPDDTTLTAGPVLLWEEAGSELRLEGVADRDAALRLAEDLVPHDP